MQDLTSSLYNSLTPPKNAQAPRKPQNRLQQLYSSVLKLERKTAMQSADQQLLSQIEAVIDQSNRELAAEPSGNSIEDVLYRQQKQIVLRHIQSLNKFYQQEVRKEKAYENDFRLAKDSAVNALDFNQEDQGTLQTVELSQQLTIQQTRDNKFSKIVNTLQDIAVLQKQVASQVEMQGQNIYRIGENIDNTDRQVTRANQLF